MSYATVQDVLFALDLDRCRVAESAEPTPRRPRGRTRITGVAVKVALRSLAQSSGQAQGSPRDELRRESADVGQGIDFTQTIDDIGDVSFFEPAHIVHPGLPASPDD